MANKDKGRKDGKKPRTSDKHKKGGLKPHEQIAIAKSAQATSA